MIAARGGLHLVEWACELAGTALLLLCGLSAVVALGVIPSMSPRLLVTGVLFAGGGSLVAVSPLGRRSGAHLNPAVTLAFWITRHVHRDDLAGYVAAQMLGGLLGFGLTWLLWGRRLADARVARTVPGHGVTLVEAAAIEAGMTAALVFLIFAFVSRPETARWTPVGTWVLIALFVWQVAPLTGTSLNPARSLGPALAGGALGVYWIYVVGPLTGGSVAAIATRMLGTRLHTAKLFHDPRYPSTLAHTPGMARSD